MLYKIIIIILLKYYFIELMFSLSLCYPVCNLKLPLLAHVYNYMTCYVNIYFVLCYRDWCCIVKEFWIYGEGAASIFRFMITAVAGNSIVKILVLLIISIKCSSFKPFHTFCWTPYIADLFKSNGIDITTGLGHT